MNSSNSNNWGMVGMVYIEDQKKSGKNSSGGQGLVGVKRKDVGMYLIGRRP